jgi:parallel beta-helix repeat protein
MEGDTRPQGSGYDIGADEHVGPRGFIVLDREGYRLGADVNILVMDSDLNINPTAAEQYSDIIAIVTTGGDEESGITMMETGPDTGMFLGSITIAQAPVTTEDGILQIECGMSDVITATYYETGNPEPPTDTADTDCYPPEITGTQVTDIGDIKSTMTWDTDEPADSCVQYGTSVPPLLSACDTSLVTDHTINLTGLSPDTTYYFATVSTDRAGNQTVDDNNGQYYQFTTLAQGTHYVPDDFVTIQEGLNLLSSTSQNEIVVRPGTYAETVNFMGKEITVRSESGPEVTLIDGGYADEVVIFDAGEGPDAVLDGFTISNGAYCGISCEADTSPTITNCIITGNSDGGMYSSDASPTISNCTITSNAGGGMRCWGGSPTIIHCTIAYNMNPDFLGGAMFLFSGCSPEISHCTLSNNTAAAGGAIWCQDSSPTITNCTITDNSAQEGGGGIDVGWSNLTIDKCTLSGNSGDDGGAISIRWDSTASISNCVISARLTATRSAARAARLAPMTTTRWVGGQPC